MDGYDVLDSLKEEFMTIQISALTHRINNRNISEIVEHVLVNGIKSDREFVRDSYIEMFSSIDIDSIEDNIYSYDDSIYKSYLDKTQERVTDELISYSDIYEFSSDKIENDDWDNLFDEMYSLYKQKGINNLFYDDMSKLNKYSISTALLLERNDVMIDDYINSITYIDSINICDKEDIQRRLYKYIDSKDSKIIDFNKYKSKRKVDNK